MKKCVCGHEMPDEALFCTECGTKFPEKTAPTPPTSEPAEKPAEPGKSAEPEKTGETKAAFLPKSPEEKETAAFLPETSVTKKKAKEKAAKDKKKTLITVLVSVILALIICVTGSIFIYVRFFGGYRAPIRKTVKLLNESVLDENEFFAYTLPKFAQKDYKKFNELFGSVNESYDAGFSSRLEKQYSDWSEAYGPDYQLTYELSRAEHLTTNELRIITALWNSFDSDLAAFNLTMEDEALYDALLKDYEERTGTEIPKKTRKNLIKLLTGFGRDMHTLTVDDGYRVTMRYTVAGSLDSQRNRITFNIIKIDGKWYLDLMSYIEGNCIYAENIDKLLELTEKALK